MKGRDKDVKKESWTINLCKTMCKNNRWSLHDGEVYHKQIILFQTKNLKFIKSRVSQILKDHPESDPRITGMMQPGVGRYQEWHPVKDSRGWARWFFMHDDKTEEGIPVYFVRLHPSKENFGGLTDTQKSKKLATNLIGIDPDGTFVGDE